jgi:acetyl esterase/lipase
MATEPIASAEGTTQPDQPDHRDRYGPDALHLVDLFAPHGTTSGSAGRGLVILLHGGFWRARWDRTHLYPMAAAIAAAGFAVALPEYRRVGDPGGGWPGTGDDVLRLLDTVPELAESRFGAANRMVVVGHSAGGHLSVWAAGARTREVEHPIDLVVSLAGVLDLTAAHDLRLSDDAVGELLGERADDAEALEAADPMQRPLPPVPLTLLHGAVDDEVPSSFTRAFAARDPRIRLIELPDAGHYELIDPASTAWPDVLAALGTDGAAQPTIPGP